VRPGVSESEPSDFLLGGKFGGSFDDRAQRFAQTVGILTVEVIDTPEFKWLICFHRHQSSTLPRVKWCPQGTTFVRQLCDLVGMVTAKAQLNLKNAKQYFQKHLAAGDYYEEEQKIPGEWFGDDAQRLRLAAVLEELAGKPKDGQPVIAYIGGVSASDLDNRSGKRE
jgi:hypothetical protein